MNPNSLTTKQIQVAKSKSRFKVLASGRRFGKTYLAIYELLRKAAQVDQNVWYVAPSYRQAKQIAWKMLKEAIATLNWPVKYNESDLSCYLRQSGSTIALRGADNYDSLRGVGIDFLIIDEAADVKREAWVEVLRPTLSDTGGKGLFIGTPKGRNWFYDLYMRGKEDVEGWDSWQFTTVEGGNVPPEEIEAAKADLDDLTYAQEYLASFVNFEGRVYYAFTYETHCVPLKYDPKLTLALSYDFNVEPGVCAVSQEQTLPNGLLGTGIIGEVYIPRNSNTSAVCRKVIADWGKHEGRVFCYGDATGGARGSAKIMGSDWDIIRQELKPTFGDRLQIKVKSANPPERVRVNAVNSRIKNTNGEIKMMVDPVKAPNVVRDFEGVQLLKGGSGEIDKKTSPMLTHISDGIGYQINYEYPIIRPMSRVQLVGI